LWIFFLNFDITFWNLSKINHPVTRKCERYHFSMFLFPYFLKEQFKWLPREYFIRKRQHRILYHLLPREKRTMTSFYRKRSTTLLQQTTLNRYETLTAAISTIKESRVAGQIFLITVIMLSMLYAIYER
jgi:hypothetical protein